MSAPPCLLLCDELPLPGRTGYGTYLHAMLRRLDASLPGSLVVVAGPRLPPPGTDPRAATGCPGLRFAALHALSLGGRWFPRTPQALLRLGAGLKRRLVRRSAGGAAAIGREITAAEVAGLRRLIARTGAPRLALIDTIFRTAALRALPPTVHAALIAHDVFSQRCASMRAAGLTPTPWVDPALEAERLRAYATIIAISDPDAAALAALAPGRRSLVLPGVSAGRAAAHPAPAQPRLLFLGSGAHHNVDGLRWFLDSAWPAVRARVPQAALDIVGTVCASVGEAPPGVVLHGRVDDPARIARGCTAALNPLRCGSGMKIKLLDYFASGLPCISTTLGAEGFPELDPSPILRADDPAAVAAAAAALLLDAADRDRRAAAAVRMADRFGEEAFAAAFAAVAALAAEARP